MQHIPVLLKEILREATLHLSNPKNYFDGTFGRGGHARALRESFPEMQILAFDKDADAVGYAETDTIFRENFKIWHEDFRFFNKYLKGEFKNYLGEGLFDLILIDLGVSSPQLDNPERGFSFYHDGPLDMRMDQRQELTAAEIVNYWTEEDLITLFKNYGEIRNPFRVVKAIVNHRLQKPIQSTLDLAQLIESTDGWRQKGKHPATQHFLALRMKVNEELDPLESSICNLMDGLTPGGLLMVISFHSLEDRIIKQLFRNSPEKGAPLYKKVIQPSWEDQKSNPRARSAKLRIFQKKVSS